MYFSIGTYDGLAVAGGMGEGHIPSDAIIEMIRIVKPGIVNLILVKTTCIQVIDLVLVRDNW